MHELTKQFLAAAVAMILGAVTISWGYFSIDNVRAMSLAERLMPLGMASLFSCALLATAFALVRRRDDEFD
jgi:hypothetical protein